MNVIVNILRRLNVIPVPLIDTQSQLLRARAVLEANRLGVFAELEKSGSGLSAGEVAARVNISEAGAAVLLTALAAVGYLRQRGDRYQNGRWVRTWITNPQHGLSNYLLLQHHLWTRLDGLGEMLQAGGPPTDPHQESVSRPSAEQDVYTRAMRELAWLILPQFLKQVKLPPGAKRMLDIGGAHGEYSRALVRRHPGLQATVFDLPGPIASAERILAEEGNPEDIQLRAGNALQEDLGADWDVVLMANVAHAFGPDQNRDLFRRIRDGLSDGGVLIVTDQFTGLGRMRDMLPSLLSLNFFTVGGRCYSVKDFRQFLTDAGFSRIELKTSPPWRPSSIFEAWK